MASNCSCFTCSQYTNIINSGKIDFLKKDKTSATENDNLALSTNFGDLSSPFDRLPDELLIHILGFIPPDNLDNIISLLGLEIVSKRFRRCVADNENHWGNITELVIGSHRHLAQNQYLCHIGHFTLIPFLRLVKKVEKIIVNVDDEWMCDDMMKNQFIPALNRFNGKIEFQQLIFQECSWPDSIGFQRSLVKKLINCGIPYLQSAQVHAEKFSDNEEICVALAECPLLKNLRLSFDEWESENLNDRFYGFIYRMKSLQVLELNQYDESLIDSVTKVLLRAKHSDDKLSLQVIRFIHPLIYIYGQMMLYSLKTTMVSLLRFFRYLHSSSINEVEIHFRAVSDDFTRLPELFNDVSHSMHLKITFIPVMKLNKAPKIAQLLENGRLKDVDDLKISITFLHFEENRNDTLAIVHSLLETFDVPLIPEKEDQWEFIRRKLYVTLKMVNVENYKDLSMVRDNFRQLNDWS